jgi:FkbM family methyltransferase
MSLERRRLGLLLLAGLIICTVGKGGWWAYDAILVASVVAASGLLWTSSRWRARLAAALMILGGLVWSALDVGGCSFGSRVRLFYEKAAGHLPYISWLDVSRSAFRPVCFASYEHNPEIPRSVQLIEQKPVGGYNLQRYSTPLGEFWIAPPGKRLLEWIVWEIEKEQVYESRNVRIEPGDTVVDCGAHVGVFTRHALRRGAARVIAVEPDSANIAALEATFPREITEGRVVLVKGGVWDQVSLLTLTDSHDNSAGHSFVIERQNSEQVSGIPVWPLDDIVARLQLDRVDFIKMDIEGAERRALAGARLTLGRFRPRLAICTYHLPDDTVAVPAVVRKANPSYLIHAKDAENQLARYVTKVMFFHAPS